MTERTVFQSITQRHLVCLGPSASVYKAACLMTGENCGSVLIIETNGDLVGILTERDLMTRVIAKELDPQRAKVADVMTRNPYCVLPDTKVADAVLILIERGFRHLPIVTAQKRILGVFSIRDAMPREINSAVSLAEFNEQVNDVLS